MDPDQVDRSAVSLQDKSVAVIPDPYRIFSEVDHQLLQAIRIETLNFGRLIDLDVPDQVLVLQIPDLEFLRGVHDHQVRAHRHL